MSDPNVRRLMAWNRFWLAVVMLVLLSWAASVGLDRLSDRSRVRIRTAWSERGLELRSSSDGPFVVTCLVHGVGTGEVRYAVLPEPLVIIESGVTILEPAALRRLTWRDWMGGTDAPPPEGTPMKALYSAPLESVASVEP